MPLTDLDLWQLLRQSRVIAVVGHSDNPDRPSCRIGRYLRQAGYRVYAVNPLIAQVEGEPAYPDLGRVPEPIDIVNVFRRPEHLPDVVEQAIRCRARAVWAQLGVAHPAAEDRARAAGLLVVSDACIMVEHRRLGVPPRD